MEQEKEAKKAYDAPSQDEKDEFDSSCTEADGPGHIFQQYETGNTIEETSFTHCG